MSVQATRVIALASLAALALGSGCKASKPSPTSSAASATTLSAESPAASAAPDRPKGSCDHADLGSCRDYLEWGLGGEANMRKMCEEGLRAGGKFSTGGVGCPARATSVGSCLMPRGRERVHYYKVGLNKTMTDANGKEGCEKTLRGEWTSVGGAGR